MRPSGQLPVCQFGGRPRKTEGTAVASAFLTVLLNVKARAASHFASVLCMTLSNCSERHLTTMMQTRHEKANELSDEEQRAVNQHGNYS